jgi:hypothetical protein
MKPQYGVIKLSYLFPDGFSVTLLMSELFTGVGQKLLQQFIDIHGLPRIQYGAIRATQNAE